MSVKGEDMSDQLDQPDRPDQPLVGILMGSESDAHVMDEAGKELEAQDIAYEVNVLSAHRDPEAVREYSLNAEGRGLRIIIAGAGKAAALLFRQAYVLWT